MMLSTTFPRIPEVQKIAVLRANAIGDFIFALPALESLRAAYPEAEIVLLGRRWHVEFLSGRPGPVDRAIEVPPCRGVNEGPRAEDPSELGAFFERMRAERFDVALQMHGGGRHSNPFIRRLGARITAGSRSADAIPLDRWVPYVRWHPEVLRYLEIASLAGAPPVTLEPRVRATETDIEEARLAVPEIDGPAPVVVINPSATDPRRRWPPEKFAAAGDALARAGAAPVLNGTGDERSICEAVLARMANPAAILCGRLSLCGLTGLIARSKLVLSNDTGPFHLAVALGIPAVGIFWCGNSMTGGPLTLSASRIHVSWRLECPLCGAGCMNGACHHDASLVAEVDDEDVIASAMELLGRSRGHAGVRFYPGSHGRLSRRST